MPRLLFASLQIQDGSRKAGKMTREEFENNLYHIVKEWNKVTNLDNFWLSYDNEAVQATATWEVVVNPNDPTDTIDCLVNGCKLPLPSYSHDLNRPIEHLFGTVKHHLRCQLYEDWSLLDDHTKLQDMVRKVFYNLPTYGWAQHVEKDVAGLPQLWQMLKTPQGVSYLDEKHRVCVGAGGDYPNAFAR